MRILRIFGLCSKRILDKGHVVTGRVSMVQKSCLYVIKKPVRLYISESNTRYSHYITFSYTVNDISFNGKLFIDPYTRCPQKDEEIQVFYDPDKPEDYACYSFGPAVLPIGW